MSAVADKEQIVLELLENRNGDDSFNRSNDCNQGTDCVDCDDPQRPSSVLTPCSEQEEVHCPEECSGSRVEPDEGSQSDQSKICAGNCSTGSTSRTSTRQMSHSIR